LFRCANRNQLWGKDLRIFFASEQIAEIAVAILSDSASSMTGSAVSVDGEVTAWYGI
jgi:enoyl-[acyl-carrier-protein] reductase (NADH)